MIEKCHLCKKQYEDITRTDGLCEYCARDAVAAVRVGVKQAQAKRQEKKE